MLPKVSQFVINHWALVGVFIAVFAFLILEESRSQKAGGTKLTITMATHLMNHENAVILDLREANTFRDGHIINAKNFPLSEFERHADKLNAYRSQPVILVDAMGTKTNEIAIRLKKLGFEKINVLKGGMSAWRSASMPIVK